jgi:hypothetical protein
VAPPAPPDEWQSDHDGACEGSEPVGNKQVTLSVVLPARGTFELSVFTGAIWSGSRSASSAGSVGPTGGRNGSASLSLSLKFAPVQ